MQAGLSAFIPERIFISLSLAVIIVVSSLLIISEVYVDPDG
jgi:hypothetical protein